MGKTVTPLPAILAGHDDTGDLFRLVLSNAGFRCVSAKSPNEAIAHASRVRFDAAVIGLGLRGFEDDAVALARHLRGIDHPPLLIAVMGRGIVAPADADLFAARIPMPVDPANVVATVARVVEQ